MTVKEYVEARVKEIDMDFMLNDLQDLIMYSLDAYGHSINEEYKGDYAGPTVDPWLNDVVCLKKAMSILNKTKNEKKGNYYYEANRTKEYFAN